MYKALKLFLLLLCLPYFIFTMEETDSPEKPIKAHKKQRILDHFEGNVFNIKQIYDDISFLTQHALNGNKKALMLLVEYTESTKAVFDFFSYGVHHDTLFNSIPWNTLPLDFFKKNQPKTPQEYYYWGMFYANSMLQKLNYHKDMVDDLKEVAFNYIHKSAEEKFPKAVYWLGHLHYHGWGTTKDSQTAFFWKNEAASQYLPAVFDVGLMYLKGVGIPKNPDMGLALVKAVAVDHHSPTANHYLGLIHERDQNYLNREKACEYYEKAAKMGCLDAKNNLGLLYLNSNKDIIQGLHYMNKAAQKGSAHAKLCLGLVYCKGDPIKQDITKGIQLIKAAAQLNHPLAFYQLGKMHIRGSLIKKNVKKGLKLLQRSSHPLALYRRSKFYIYGTEKKIPQNTHLGISLLQQAVNAGLAKAQFLLGKLYLEGEYIEKNDKRGLNLIAAAARKGFKPAMQYQRNYH